MRKDDDPLVRTVTRGTHAQLIRNGSHLYLYVRHDNPLYLVEDQDELRELTAAS